MIRGGRLTTGERVVAGVIGAGVLAASLVGFAVALRRGHAQLVLAAIGCIGIAGVFLRAAVIGRAL